ncbi:hypothetical protein CEV32_1048 [Brucella rhizosphaerae]|uniref:Uncharacterized protein n=1 Tax=Brucella rhizosphaerae TaxID=571254 RepID=A0A256FDJ3_9HYPH|nr:hypothetical protein CEV32_1048 [Brucella rhizosphaerae]
MKQSGLSPCERHVGPFHVVCRSMIWKSENRFSDKIMVR